MVTSFDNSPRTVKHMHTAISLSLGTFWAELPQILEILLKILGQV